MGAAGDWCLGVLVLWFIWLDFVCGVLVVVWVWCFGCFGVIGGFEFALGLRFMG